MREEKQPTLGDKILGVGVPLGVGGVILGGAGLFIYAAITSFGKPMYSGPIGMPEVQKVEVFTRYESCGKECSRANGLSIDIFPEAGGKITVRDYGADFGLDGIDTVDTSTDAPQMELADVLQKTGDTVVPAFFASQYGRRSGLPPPSK